MNGCDRREIKNWHYRYLLIIKLLNRIINGFVTKEGVRVEEVQLKWTARRRARDQEDFELLFWNIAKCQVV